MAAAAPITAAKIGHFSTTLLVPSARMAQLISELGDDLESVARRFGDCRLGIYLHGSHARGEAGPRSDIDVIGLCAVEREGTWQAAEQACQDALATRLWSDQLDLKVVDAAEFSINPWVDLRRAHHLAGYAWHEQLLPRTVDQAGRESLLVLGVLFEDDAFADRADPAGLRKSVGRLCSVLAGLTAGAIPQSAAEAVALLGEAGRLPRALGAMRSELAQLPNPSVVPEELSDRVQRVAADVAAVLRAHVEHGVLGPVSTAAGEQALAKYRASSAPQSCG
ncbi:nucleotidyltransferase domain-containing protein [Microlunatus speluncae]|uniref:nucleotidyltransferase domain-containing protein n=1 Tax=Microlunatus speluncae TaxID=2594267 RepID=UPI001FEA376D|nr:nucleotidyltransferase domain-containing protein [Microlunatus speluncae]